MLVLRIFLNESKNLIPVLAAVSVLPVELNLLQAGKHLLHTIAALGRSLRITEQIVLKNERFATNDGTLVSIGLILLVHLVHQVNA